MKALPLNASEIGLEWPIEEGGIGVTAKTDRAGEPLLGLYPLHPRGFPSGQPTEFNRPRLMIGVVAGYDECQDPIKIFIDVEITGRGLKLRVVMPSYLRERGHETELAAQWGSVSPRLRYETGPQN